MSEHNKQDAKIKEADPNKLESGQLQEAEAQTAESETANADTAKPESAKPETAESASAEQETSKSEPAESKSAEPETAKSETDEPESAKPSIGNAPKRKEVASADADQSAPKKPAAKKPAPKKPAAKKKEEDDKPKPPSPNQPKLDQIVALIRENISPDAVEEAWINELDRHLPTIVIRPEHWVEVSHLLLEHEQLQLNYLRSISGVDQETHMEVVYHLLSFATKDEYCFKVKTNREQPSIPSVVPVWKTADWNEREIYDLLGIDFPGHPDLRRIMMPDDWVGHPLRKDYEPYDPEV